MGQKNEPRKGGNMYALKVQREFFGYPITIQHNHNRKSKEFAYQIAKEVEKLNFAEISIIEVADSFNLMIKIFHKCDVIYGTRVWDFVEYANKIAASIHH